MTPVAASQLIAVLVGALVAALSGFVSTVLLERHRRNVLSRNMALAFKGEINALVSYIAETHYAQSFENAIARMQATGRPTSHFVSALSMTGSIRVT